jgi:uncharacterized protein (DUF885 family)
MERTMQKMGRRDVLTGATAISLGGLGGLLPTALRAQGAAAPAADRAFFALLDGFTDTLLQLSPEGATQLGLDHGALAPLRGDLSHVSPAATETGNATVRTIAQQLAQTDRGTLLPANQLRYDTLRYATQTALDGTGFAYGGGALSGIQGGTGPYVISQQGGAVNGVPELLVSSHGIKDKADAQAYLARIAAFARLLDEESAQITADAGRGVVPPRFIAENALGILKGFRATPAAEQSLVTNLAAKTRTLGLSGYGERAAGLLEKLVYPALDREIAAFAAATATAPMTASVQRLPDGEAYYRWALRLGTTTRHSPEEIHRVGLDQNEAIKARMDVLLKAQGLTRGSVGERAAALGRDPHQLYPDNDAGRAALIAELEQRIANVRAIMPRFSGLGLKAEVKVRRVPPDIQDGAPRGYMQPAPLDGSRPAIYYINLKTTAMWPRPSLATLTAHEGIPGHTWQLAYLAEHHAQVPAIASLIGFNAFVEGWALYAEQLVDESGLYDHDPWSRIGYLQAQQFRACRLVVDTGIHAMGWTREQAIDFLCAQTGSNRVGMTSEIDRYCVAPGQACGYKTGHNEILRLRAKAQAALGAKFDLAGYNDAVITSGGVPLDLLTGVVDRHIAARLAAG